MFGKTKIRARTFFRAVRPILSVVAVIATASALVAAIVFSELGTQWAIFLTGILVAATLSLASRSAHAEWTIARRSAKLNQVQDKLAQEQRRRRDTEARLESGKRARDLLESGLPVMVACLDREGKVRVHSRALRDWLGLPADQIDGGKLADLLGDPHRAEVTARIETAIGGRPVAFELPCSVNDGQRGRLEIRLVPDRESSSAVGGLFVHLLEAAELSLPSNPDETQPLDKTWADRAPAAPAVVSPAEAAAARNSEQSLFVETFSEQVSGSNEAIQRIVTAIEQNEFRLYSQHITPLAGNSATPGHHEILVRLIEEEEGMMPPGAFLPLVEEYGLMPRLDRWVVEHAAQWAMSSANHRPGVSSLFINLAAASLRDPDFPAYVGEQVAKYSLPPGSLCFEITAADLSALRDEIVEFVGKVRRHGCHIALSGFGRDGVSFDPLRGIRVNFLKIDGSIILNILRDSVELARVAAIARVAKTIEVKTVAEYVESDQCIAKLRELGIDFAQGFEISRPCPLDALG